MILHIDLSSSPLSDAFAVIRNDPDVTVSVTLGANLPRRSLKGASMLLYLLICVSLYLQMRLHDDWFSCESLCE